MAFARYEKNRKMKEEFLLSNTLSATTTAAVIKALVDFFLKPTSSAGRISSTSVLTCPAMIGVKSGFIPLVKNEWPHVTSSHCLIYP